MTEHRYLQVFGESSDALYANLGVNFEHAEEGAYYTLESHIRHRAEARVATELWSETEILGYDEKRLHLFHRLYNAAGDLLATGEHLSIHVKFSAVAPASAQMLQIIGQVFDDQAGLSIPDGSGSVLKKRLSFTRS